MAPISALVAQRIERRFPKPDIEVRFLTSVLKLST